MNDESTRLKVEATCKISSLKVKVYTVPTDLPESDGTFSWNSTTIILVEIEAAGKKGIGYTYAHFSTALLIQKSLADLVTGKNIFDIPAITRDLTRAIRNDGTCGIAMMAVSAIDCALWDLKAHILDVPLCVLLGKKGEEILIYGSGGFTSYTISQLNDQFGKWAGDGLRYMKMKIGRQPEKDMERIRSARGAIGNDRGLFVDANGAYTARQALENALRFTEYDVSWFEEPVSSDDLQGLAFLKRQLPAKVRLAAGEYGYGLFYFQNMLRSEAVDILQADATRCGGISGFLAAGYLCQAAFVPYSSHCAPTLHLHVALSLPSFYIAEYFHDHVRIEEMLFDGVPKPVNGFLKPDLSRPGLGLECKYSDMEKYSIN